MIRFPYCLLCDNSTLTFHKDLISKFMPTVYLSDQFVKRNYYPQSVSNQLKWKKESLRYIKKNGL